MVLPRPAAGRGRGQTPAAPSSSLLPAAASTAPTGVSNSAAPVPPPLPNSPLPPPPTPLPAPPVPAAKFCVRCAKALARKPTLVCCKRPNVGRCERCGGQRAKCLSVGRSFPSCVAAVGRSFGGFGLTRLGSSEVPCEARPAAGLCCGAACPARRSSTRRPLGPRCRGVLGLHGACNAQANTFKR